MAGIVYCQVFKQVGHFLHGKYMEILHCAIVLSDRVEHLGIGYIDVARIRFAAEKGASSDKAVHLLVGIACEANKWNWGQLDIL